MSKLVGILGGTSWPSTMLPYRKLNSHVQERLGGHHSARILLYSSDFHAIKSLYHGGWDSIPSLLQEEIQTLLAWQPDCWMLANNTLRKAYDEIAHELPSKIPFFHAVTLVCQYLVDAQVSRVRLLGTKFTMEDGFFAAPLQAAGIRVDLPDAANREKIQKIQCRLARGETEESFAAYFRALLENHRRLGCEVVVTACTELPLVIDQSLTKMRVLDPLDLQVKACAEFALA